MCSARLSGWFGLEGLSPHGRGLCSQAARGTAGVSRTSGTIFTPSTKAEHSHDENISEATVREMLGEETTTFLRETSLKLYNQARDYARRRGIIIADTKFEFGRADNGEFILVDEVLTPDSSRFWPLEAYVAGKSQPSFDKQFVRDYLETLKWDKKPPAPAIPVHIAEATTGRYLEAYKLITERISSFSRQDFTIQPSSLPIAGSPPCRCAPN